MAHTELTTARLRAILGAGTGVGTAPDGVPLAVPESAEACALVLRTATQEQWRVRVEGGARWSPPDAPADLVLTTAGLRRVTDVSGTDLVATAEAGSESGRGYSEQQPAKRGGQPHVCAVT